MSPWFLAQESVGPGPRCTVIQQRLEDFYTGRPKYRDALILVALIDGAPEQWHYLRAIASIDAADEMVHEKCKNFARLAEATIQQFQGLVYPNIDMNQRFTDGTCGVFEFGGLLNALGAALRIHDNCRRHNTYFNLEWQNQLHARIVIAENFVAGTTLFRPMGCIDRDGTALSYNLLPRDKVGVSTVLDHLSVRILTPHAVQPVQTSAA